MDIEEKIMNFFRERKIRRQLRGSLGKETIDDRFERYDLEHKERLLDSLLRSIEEAERRISELREQRRTMIFDDVRPFVIEKVEDRIAHLEADLTALREKYNRERAKLDALRANVLGREGMAYDQAIEQKETDYRDTKEALNQERARIEASKGTPRGSLEEADVAAYEENLDVTNGANRDRLIAEAILKDYSDIIKILDDLIENGDPQYKPTYERIKKDMITGEISTADVYEELLDVEDSYSSDKKTDIFLISSKIKELLDNHNSDGITFSTLFSKKEKEDKYGSKSYGIALETLSSKTQEMIDSFIRLYQTIFEGLNSHQKEVLNSIIEENKKYVESLQYYTFGEIPYNTISDLSQTQTQTANNQVEVIETIEEPEVIVEERPIDAEFGRRYKIAHREERRTRTAKFMNEITAAAGYGIMGLSAAVMYGTAFVDPATNIPEAYEVVINDLVQKIGSDPSLGNILEQVAKGPGEFLIGAILFGTGLVRYLRNRRSYRDAKQARVDMENELGNDIPDNRPRHL